MKSNSSLTINRTASDTIAAAIQELLFFFRGQLYFILCTYFNFILLEMSRVTKVLSHMIGVRKKADSQKGVRKAADSQKKGSAKQKVWEPLI